MTTVSHFYILHAAASVSSILSSATHSNFFHNPLDYSAQTVKAISTVFHHRTQRPVRFTNNLLNHSRSTCRPHSRANSPGERKTPGGAEFVRSTNLRKVDDTSSCHAVGAPRVPYTALRQTSHHVLLNSLFVLIWELDVDLTQNVCVPERTRLQLPLTSNNTRLAMN